MRKLLVLILVLGISSAANALIVQVNDQVGEVVVAPGEAAVVTVVADDASSWLGYLIVDAGGLGAVSNAVAEAAAGDLAAAVEYPDEPEWGLGYELTAAASPTGVIAEGTQFTVSYSYEGDLIQPTTISLFVDPDYDNPAAGVTIVPEPITVALLGLGGLFIRRRK